MCGLTGYWEREAAEELVLQARVSEMNRTLVHRGPDDQHVWTDAEAGVALGACRLAIVDLSPQGRQPMCSESGRYVIAYNGEVYNFSHLRQQLEPLGHAFRGGSDTEVILAAVEEWGLEAAVRRFVGMFAFALWDRRERTLSLVRDRMGIKPLYYGWMGGSFLFGSELKALRAHPRFLPEIDRGALTLYMRYGYVPTPHSIFRGVSKLTPGCILTLQSPHHRPQPEPYWSVREVVEAGMAEPFDGSEGEAIDQLEQLIRQSVRLRMVADVPVGAFLSGGLDSSTVVALMQAESKAPVKTFTIGSHDVSIDEATHARTVAAHLQTEHEELYVSPAEARSVIPRLADIYDEPFADSSQIPTFLVSRLARSKVTVSLSGDGGDELFGGYHRYWVGASIWKNIRRVPPGIRAPVARGMKSVDTPLYDRSLGWLLPYTGRFGHQGRVGQKVHRLAELLRARSADDLYHTFVSHWDNPGGLVFDGSEPPVALREPVRWTRPLDFVQRMMYFDAVSYLPDDILTKVDRASMAVSLEARVPLLDHRVVEFAWRLPLDLKIRDGTSKYILRRILSRHLPQQLIDHPKMGFSISIGTWLRGPLREWADDLLAERRLREGGFLRPEPVREIWRQHLGGHRNWEYRLWIVLMFQSWLEGSQVLVEPDQYSRVS